MSRTNLNEFESHDVVQDNECYFKILDSIKLLHGQYHFEDITQYLIFLCMGGGRATISQDTDINFGFNLSDNVEEHSDETFDKAQNQKDMLNLEDTYVTNQSVTVDSSVIPDTQTWTSGSATAQHKSLSTQ